MLKFEFICHHPFIKDTYTPVPCEKPESNPAGMEMLDVRDKDNLERIKSFYIEGIDSCKKALDFFIVINKPYSGVFFKLIKDLLNRKDYTDMLETLWTMMEYPNKDVNVTFEPNKIAMQIPCTLLKLKSLATNNTAMDTYKILDIPINQGVAKNLLLSKKG